MVLRSVPPSVFRSLALLLAVAAGLAESTETLSVATILMALPAAAGRRHRAMLGWIGMAGGTGLSILLVAPFFLALLISRRVPMRHWAIAPLVAGSVTALRLFDSTDAMLGPPSIAGALSLPLPMPMPTIWTLMRAMPVIGDLPLLGLALATTIGAVAAYVAWLSVRPLYGPALLSAALSSSLLGTLLMPWMPPTTLLLPVTLALARATGGRGASRWPIAALVGIGTLPLLSGDYANGSWFAPVAAAALLIAGARLALTSGGANDNSPSGTRPHPIFGARQAGFLLI